MVWVRFEEQADDDRPSTAFRVIPFVDNPADAPRAAAINRALSAVRTEYSTPRASTHLQQMVQEVETELINASQPGLSAEERAIISSAFERLLGHTTLTQQDLYNIHAVAVEVAEDKEVWDLLATDILGFASTYLSLVLFALPLIEQILRASEDVQRIVSGSLLVLAVFTRIMLMWRAFVGGTRSPWALWAVNLWVVFTIAATFKAPSLVGAIVSGHFR